MECPIDWINIFTFHINISTLPDMPETALLSWIGKHDRRAPTAPDPKRASSIVTALQERSFSRVILFDNLDSEAFVTWLKEKILAPSQKLEVIVSTREDDSD